MTCSSRKCLYGSKPEAKAAIRRSQRHIADAGRLRAYRCPECGYFHIGHLSASVIGGWMSRGERYGTGAAA